MAGRLVVITGPMFAGKTAELLRRVRRARRAGISAVLLKPEADTRAQGVRSHDGLEEQAARIPPARSDHPTLIPLVSDARVVAIDEAQFLDGTLHVGHVPEILHLVDEGRTVIAAGLDLDYAGSPFGVMPLLLAFADEVVKLTAICVRCGREATRTQRLRDGEPAGIGPVVQIGGEETYEARCRDCWVPPWRVG